MIPRYLVGTLIVVLFAAAVLIQKSALDIPVFIKSTSKAEASAVQKKEPIPKPNNNYQNPQTLTARAAIVIDAKTGTILFEKNAKLKHLPASTTKLMTALISLEKCSQDTIVTVGQIEEEGTQMNLKTGDQVTVENLLFGLLINSGNDSAAALSAACSESQSRFIESMNQKAQELEMKSTHFTNPTGFDDAYQYSTAEDLAKLANVAIANPLISKIVSTKSTVVTDVTGLKTYYLENVNELLEAVDGLVGIKTGQTEGSLENLITKTTRNNNSVVVVILGSQDRFSETQDLIEWAFKSYDWIQN